jgi:hypothetical protein
MIALIISQLWSAFPCGELGAKPHPDAELDGVEFCAHMEDAYSSLQEGHFGNAYLSAVAADKVSKFEWETNTPLLIMAEAACKSDNLAVGLEHIDTFLCISDIHSEKFTWADSHTHSFTEIRERISKQYPRKDGWRVNITQCHWAFDSFFPNDFDQYSSQKPEILYTEAYRIKDLCTPQDK